LFPLLLVDDEELLPEVSTTDPLPPPSLSPDFLRPKPNIFLLDSRLGRRASLPLNFELWWGRDRMLEGAPFCRRYVVT
jgi:hypothetical protein